MRHLLFAQPALKNGFLLLKGVQIAPASCCLAHYFEFWLLCLQYLSTNMQHEAHEFTGCEIIYKQSDLILCVSLSSLSRTNNRIIFQEFNERTIYHELHFGCKAAGRVGCCGQIP